ncbi:MAG: bifunctional 5,10-methylene-tetrahydrofolate dehydrogenase/5,10-methylene-tetrahydrofolate cyclohydrolase [Trueperaceae bacterium]|nr:MAG: bifunctional 5,10-methylene-tetrahydrofolate dehydrogenase/5,10-methylene-tetrahydrofolate cyclohydrolase [Trueperaceae bacterium]
MSAYRLDGREVADALLDEVMEAIRSLDLPPKLVFVRVGDDPASISYVRSKERLARRAGIFSEVVVLPADADQQELLSLIARLNENDRVDGVLVQLPLPDRLDETAILNAIDPEKDVDGFHPVNVGRLWSGQVGLFPCTPTGLITILDHFGIEIESKHVVIVGRSNLVGKPAAALFLRRHATVSIAHSRTKDLPALVRQADILVSAVGKAGLITPDMIKQGAVVLDVGFSRDDGKIKGDVRPDVAEVASYLTPMPGGTGLVTVAMVIKNTVTAALLRRGGND